LARSEVERAEHLAHLLFHLLRFDQRGADAATARQFHIARQQDAILRARDVRQVRVGCRVFIARVVPQQTQPGCQSSQHRIGEEFHRDELYCGLLLLENRTKDVCWFVGSLVYWFVGSLVCWFVGSLVCWFVGLLVR